MPNTQYSIPASEESALVALQVIRRNGSVVNFEPEKIALALSKAFLAVEGSQSSVSARVRDLVNTLTDTVVRGLTRRMPDGGVVHIEDVQDQVELALMRAGEHDVARAYVLYRERRSAERAAQGEVSTPVTINVRVGEELRPLDIGLIRQICEEACSGLSTTNPLLILDSAMKNLYDGVPASDVKQALILSARTLIETEPDYDRVTARLLQAVLNEEVLGRSVTRKEIDQAYAEYFPLFIERGIKAELLDPRLKEFDLLRIAGALAPERDLQFGYLGMQTLYDRYFLHIDNQRIELPQTFFMRVAMGLAINEVDREERAIEFYNLISSFDFMCSTPTLFNSGTRHPQLSSCYLTTVGDDLDDIFQSVKENALLQKYAGGLGNDWTPVRALGSRIKGTNGESQGVIPFLKVVNDTAVAVNQGEAQRRCLCLSGNLAPRH